MAEVRFYQLMRKNLEQALPELLQKCLQRGWRVVVMAGSEERVETLSHRLWTYSPDSFLPHGSARDGEPDRQPIWLTARDENPNGAAVLMLTDGARSDRAGDFALVCELFDGNDPAAIETARERWRTYREAGHTLTYWQQSEKGAWEERQSGGSSERLSR